MSNITKRSKIRVISILLASIFILTTVGLVLIFRKEDPNDPNNPSNSSGPSLVYDYEKGETASNKVENAQYLPDIDAFIALNSEGDVPEYSSSYSAGYSSSPEPVEESNMTNKEFQDLVDNLSQFDTWHGGGKSDGYNMYEVKEELAYVIQHVPAFNQWFQMPGMREDQGYAEIPYYEAWQYYLELELFPLKLSVTRVAMWNSCSFMDFDNKTFIRKNEDGTVKRKCEIMKTSYYVDENGDEIIEGSIYTVAIDNVDWYGYAYNDNSADYYPLEYLYFRNIEDKAFISYNINVADDMFLHSSFQGFDDWTPNKDDKDCDRGIDVRGFTPYGYTRTFSVCNYEGYKQIKKTTMKQTFSSFREPNADGTVKFAVGDVPFTVDSENVALLADAIGISEEEYISCADASELMSKFSKHIVDNYELKDNCQEIYKGAVNSIVIDLIEGPYYGREVPIDKFDTSGNIQFYGKNHNVQTMLWVNGDIAEEAEAEFDLNTEYSLSLALKEQTTGEIIVIATQYMHLDETEYNYGPNYEGVRDTYYRFYTTSYHYKLNDLFRVKKAGVYDLVSVVTVKQDGEDVIIHDELMEEFKVYTFSDFQKIPIDNLTDEESGKTFNYYYSIKYHKFVLTVSEVGI